MLERTITGLVLGAIMISSMLWNSLSALFLLMAILIFSTKEWVQLFLNRNSSIWMISLCIFFIGIWIASNYWALNDDKHLYLLILCLLCIVQIIAYAFILFSDKSVRFISGWLSGLVYIVLPIIIASEFVLHDFETGRWLLLSFIITNWGNDTFAYFGGRLFGKTALAPKVSPKKTVEGSLVGLIGGVLCWMILNSTFQILNDNFAAVITGIGIVAAGSLGDLYESSLKRMINIKDSGTILPGHGGFLDRFDSFFFVIPVGTLLINILK